MTLLDTLKEEKQFTMTQRDIVAFINDNLETISTMTIGEVAIKTNSSNASIIRICHKLGYSGFKEFKYQLVKSIESNKYIQQSVDFTTPFKNHETTFEMMNTISSLYKESIDITHASLDPLQIEDIVNTIKNAKRFFIYAIGDTNMTVKNFINKLIKINYYPVLATDNHEEVATSKNIQKEDCVLFVTYRGDSLQLLDCMKIVKRSGCKTIVITANETSVLTRISDYHIVLPYKEKDHRMATFYSQLSFHYVLTIIYVMLHTSVKNAEL